MTRRPRWVSWIPALLLVAVLVFMVATTILTGAEHEEELAAQDDQIAELRSTRDRVIGSHTQDQESAAREGLGISPARMQEDREQMEAMLSAAFTWSSSDEYEQSRTTLARRFDLDADSGFLAEDMPPPATVTDSSGEEYDYIDRMGMTSSLDEVEGVTPVSVLGSEYTYLTVARVETGSSRIASGSGPEDQESVTRTVVLRFVFDGSSDATSVSIVAAPSGQTRQSG